MEWETFKNIFIFSAGVKLIKEWDTFIFLVCSINCKCCFSFGRAVPIMKNAFLLLKESIYHELDFCF